MQVLYFLGMIWIGCGLANAEMAIRVWFLTGHFSVRSLLIVPVIAFVLGPIGLGLTLAERAGLK